MKWIYMIMVKKFTTDCLCNQTAVGMGQELQMTLKCGCNGI